MSVFIYLINLLYITQSATPDSDPIALEIYDGRRVNVFLNIWNTRDHAPQLGEGEEYANQFASEISELLEINITRIMMTDVTLCFDLEVDGSATNCQAVYNSNPNVTIPFRPLSNTDSTHWSILLSFSFLIGPDRTATYYALYLQNAIRNRASYLYDGGLSPLATEHGRIEYYTMSVVGTYFFLGPDDPETCTSEQTNLISECTLLTTSSDCGENSECLWSSSCPSFSPPIVSVPNCLPLVHCIHSSLHTEYTITYLHNSCPYLTQPSESPENDWGKDLADEIESFFENPYLVILTVLLFFICVTACLYSCVRYRNKRRRKRIRDKPKMREHSPRADKARQFYPPSTVITDNYRSEGRAPTYSYVASDNMGPTPGQYRVQHPHSVTSVSSYSPQIHSGSKHRYPAADSYV